MPFHTLIIQYESFRSTSERDELPCACPDALVLIFLLFLISCPHHRLAPTTRHPSGCEIRRDTCSNHIPSRSSRLSPSTSLSLTPLVSRPWTTLTDTTPPPHGSHTPSFSTYFSFSFVAYTLSIQSASPALPRSPYYTKPRPIPSRIMYLNKHSRTDSFNLVQFPPVQFLFALPARGAPFCFPSICAL